THLNLVSKHLQVFAHQFRSLQPGSHLPGTASRFFRSVDDLLKVSEHTLLSDLYFLDALRQLALNLPLDLGVLHQLTGSYCGTALGAASPARCFSLSHLRIGTIFCDEHLLHLSERHGALLQCPALAQEQCSF